MYRYLVVRIAGEHAGKVAHRDVRLSGVSLTDGKVWWLNAQATEPNAFGMRDERGNLILEPWGVAIWAVDESDIIRGGGILVSVDPTTNSIQCMGYAGYTQQLHYRSSKQWIQVDPIDLAREMWDYSQTVIGTNLGVTYDDPDTPVRVGTEEDPLGMHWWELPNIGDFIDDLATQAPFEYTESHTFRADGSIDHRLRVGYPTLGNQRNDLRFAMGENIVGVPAITAAAEKYASNSYVLGPGEGDKRLVGIHSMPSPTRIERDSVADRADLSTQEALHAEARRLWYNLQETLKVTSISVRNHPNAPIGSWSYGDLILVKVDTPTIKFEQWRRVTSTAITPEAAIAAVITLEDPR